jgi:hypothetical protein
MGLDKILFAVTLAGKSSFLNLEKILSQMTEDEFEENEDIIKQCRSDQLFIQESEIGEFDGSLDEALKEAQERLILNATQLFIVVREKLEKLVCQGEYIPMKKFLEEKEKEYLDS